MPLLDIMLEGPTFEVKADGRVRDEEEEAADGEAEADAKADNDIDTKKEIHHQPHVITNDHSATILPHSTPVSLSSPYRLCLSGTPSSLCPTVPALGDRVAFDLLSRYPRALIPARCRTVG